MKMKLATACLAIGIVLAPMTANAADGVSDRAQATAYVKDSIITTKIKAKLAEEHVKSLIHINVDTDANGMVTLSGTAGSRADLDRAASIASATEGVTSVTNSIKIKKDE